MRTTHLGPGASVRYGSLKIPLAAQRDVDAAFAYLARDSVERSLIERVEQSRTPHRLVIVHNGDDSYQPSTHTIRWDPHSALMTTGGGLQSPALGLGHELDHAAQGARAYDALQSTYDFAFENAEERRVITGSERHAARTLQENARRDHDGVLYRVPQPWMR